MTKKSIAVIICFFMLLGVVLPAAPAAYTASKSVSIQHEGAVIEEITVAKDQRETLTAVAYGIDAAGWQWQILADAQSGSWVDIYDKTQAECEFSYAMINNLLDGSNSAYIRCGVICGETEVYSDPVCITVAESKSDIADDSAVEMILVEEGTSSPTAAMVLDEDGTPSEGGLTVASTEDDELVSEDDLIVANTADEETVNYYTIKIEYLDWTNWQDSGIESPIYSAYVAVLQEGAEFKKEVISPTFLGFAPYYDANGDNVVDEDATVISLDIDQLTNDITYKVYYKAVEVNYAVRYLYQNIHDDMYTENAAFYSTGSALTGTVITDAMIAAHLADKDTNKISETGFQKLYHYPEAVAADGSTVFECYYDRNYYLVQFDMQGGYGVEPIFARYGTPFLVNDPVKPGYTFAGWKLTQVDTDNDGLWEEVPAGTDTSILAEIPAYDCYYEAQWTADNTATATVVYWLQNAEPEADGTYGYSYWHAEELTGLSSGSEIAATSYSDITDRSWYEEYYEYNEGLTAAEGSAVVKGDGSTTVNVYYDRKEYTLQFVFARSNGSQYQNASATNTDDYTAVSWADRTRNESNWNAVTSSSDPECKSFINGSWTYYYFEITDKYGARIDDEWVEINNLLANNPIVSNNVFVSWRTHDGSGYAKANSSNKNLKGAYPYMDEMVIVEGSDDPHIMTAYNNTGVSYYQYEIYFLDNVTNEYVLQNAFIVNPTASYSQQTSFSYTGMTLVKKEYYDRDTSGNLVEETNINSKPDGKNSVDYPAVIRFFYDSNAYNLSFYNYNGVVDTMTKTVAYNTALSGFEPDADPDYPDVLEKNAYVFDGWYTTAGCYEGTEIDWDSDSMPAQDIMLYAKWTPVTHTVNFFNNYNDMLDYESNPDTSTVIKHAMYTDIAHGTLIGENVVKPTTSDTISGMPLTFAGWFYMENGEKKAFTPLDMPINRDMNIFADWSSQSPQPYRIQYIKYSEDSDGEKVKVADDTYGYAYGGSTRTFTAKAGSPFNQLYSTYNSGWFPTVSSHSITIEAEDDEKNPVNNVFSFEYVNVPEVSYKVRYLDKTTGLPVAPEKNATTTNSVVTERFAIVTDMVPDAFFKNLTLAVEKDADGNWVSSESNVITFYYTSNKKNAYYAVHHMMETVESASGSEEPTCTIDSGDFVEQSRTEGTGIIGDSVEVTPLSTSGFSVIDGALQYVGKTSEDSGTMTEVNLNSNSKYEITVTADGTELYIFYERKSYPYKVNYYLYNTTTEVPGLEDVDPAPAKEGTAPYGSAVSVQAPGIEGYTCVSNHVQNMTIREETASEVTQNVMTFYYSPTQHTVEYRPVTDDGIDASAMNLLSNTIEVKTGSDDFEGSKPNDNPYYSFKGWYFDEDCTQPVTGDIVDADGKLVPEKSSLSDTVSNIFYARFERGKADLVIQRTSVQDPAQVYVYKVTNNETDESMTVTVTGLGNAIIKDLPYGTYTIVQQSDWSWRYNTASVTVEHNSKTVVEKTVNNKAITGSFAEFGALPVNNNWLNGSSALIKNKRGE